MRTAKRRLVLLGVVCAGVLTVLSGAGAQVKAEEKSVFRLAESFRQEKRPPMERAADDTKADGDTVLLGKVKMEIVVPLNGILPANFDSRCAIQIVVGNYKLGVSREEDPKWKPGNPGFTVMLAERDMGRGIGGGGFGGVLPSEETKPKPFGKARIKWNLDRISIQVEGDIPGMVSPTAVLYADEEPGALNLETTAFVTLYLGSNELQRSFTMKLTGDLKRTKLSGEKEITATTIELKGEGTPKN